MEKQTGMTPLPHWSSCFAQAKEAWLTVSPRGHIWQFNAHLPSLLAVDEEALVGQNLFDLLRDVEPFTAGAEILWGTLYTLCSGSKCGAFITVEDIPCPVENWSGRLLRLHDVTEVIQVENHLRDSHRALEEQLKLLAMAEKVARLGHWRLDLHSRTVLLSNEANHFFGVAHPNEWGLGEFEALILADDREAWREQLSSCVSDGHAMGLELRMMSAEGYNRWLSVRGMRLTQRHEHEVFGVMLDITDSKHAQETILFQASHDALTGLINRVLFFDRLSQEIRRCQRIDGQFAVLFIDLDYFKAINDHFGHDAGDKVLVQVAKRLSHSLRKSDTVGRFGGDEFIAILPDLSSREVVAPLIKKILSKVEAPIMFNKEKLFVSASIGVAFYPNDATLPQMLVRKADSDMYRIKEKRRKTPHSR